MLELQTTAAIVFLVVLTIFVFLKRKKLETKQLVPYILYFSMYKTTWGLRLMDSFGRKYKKFVIYLISTLSLVGLLIIFAQVTGLSEMIIKLLSPTRGIYLLFIFIGTITTIFLIFVPLEYKMPSIGFLGMILISFGLISSLYLLFTEPEAPSGVGLVLPVKAKGIFYVPFFYWIISIFVIAVMHEFSHGVLARASNLKVKSSGFAFLGSGFRGVGFLMIIFSIYFKIRNSDLNLNYLNFFNYTAPEFWFLLGLIFVIISYLRLEFSSFGHIPVIPAAFVEPDEKELRKRPHKEQLNVFSSGPLSNLALGLIFFGIASFIIAPIANAVIEPNGVKVTDYVKGGPGERVSSRASQVTQKFPAEIAGLKIGEKIQSVDGIETPYLNNLSAVMKSKKPDEVVVIETDKSTYEIQLARNPENESAAYLGAYLEQSTKVKDNVKASYGGFLPNALLWAYGLFVILVILNFGIGLFNLVPIGPLDGGRMLQLVLHRIFDKEKGDKVWSYIGMFFLLLIFVNIVFGFIR